MPKKKTRAQLAARDQRIVDHFGATYGTNADRLPSWQNLCKDVGVPVENSIGKCKKNLEGVFVNIVQFVNAKTMDIPGQNTVRVFHSAAELSKYTKNGKTFPRDKAKKSPILRWMLIKL